MQSLVRSAFYRDVSKEIEWLVRKAGPEIADRWQEALWETITELEKFPFLGRERTDLRPAGVRTWRVNRFGRWLLFYRIQGDAIVLLRVKYGTVNLPSVKLR